MIETDFVRQRQRRYTMLHIVVVNVALLAFVGAYLTWSWTQPVRYSWDTEMDWWFVITLVVALVVVNANFFITNRRVIKAERYFANHPELENLRRAWRSN